ncbi:unnamed protein product [Prunus armeniaca]|uniref:Ferric oxidoreductase domain-containing protein n=1 Tax=Prunus armeniaca TaxID=36596 RepID=A0A6J5WYH4_PRUAR|nr:unnamed protein product [Prunus armeniaca]
MGFWFDGDSSLWMMRCMNVELADSISKRGIFSVQQLLYLPKATLQTMIGNFPASKLYQDLHPFPRIEVKLKLQRKVSLFRHHTGEHQFQARKWNTSTWELYALIREYLSLITWLFTWSYYQPWTRKWKAAEDKARATLFGYYGLNFAVYTFPPIALAIIGSFFLNLKPRESIRSGKGWKLTAGFSNPLVVNTFLGVLSTLEILAVFLFILFLAWNFYARISNDFKNLKPAKSLMLNSWQLKYLKVETRFGLLAEVCLAFLLFPILRGLALFRLLGIQFEASVRHHIWLGTAMIFFATFHRASTLFIWGVSHFIQEESQIWEWQKTGRIYLAGEICLVTGLSLLHGFPGNFLFGLDKLLLIIQSRPETCILSARIFPSKSIELILPKDPGPKYTPTSIIFVKELASSQNSGINIFLPRMQLIYVVKKSQDICPLNSISALIFGQLAEKCLLKVKVFVTQEEQSDATVRELVNEFSQVQTVNFGTKFLNFSISELEHSLRMATIAGISSILFLIFLIMFNPIFVPSQKNPTKEKTPSWVADLLIISSFILALICSIFVALVIRWRRLKKQIPPTLQKQSKALEKGSTQASDALEEHEIHFGGRPNFEADIFAKFPDETGGSDIEVLVYGPETMKESVGHQFARKNVELRSRNPISASTPSISHQKP